MAGSYSFVPRGPSPAHNTARTQDLPTERRLHKACTSPRTRMAVCAPAHTCPRPVARHARACLAHLHTRRHVHKHARSRLCTCTGPGEFGERQVTRAHAEPRVTGRGCGAEGPASGAAQDGAGATGRGGDGRGGQGGGRARAPSPGLPRQRAALRPPPPQPRASRRGPSRRRPQGAGSGPPGPAPVGGTGPAGQGAKAPREAARNPGRSPALPRPPPARPRGRGSAGAELPRDLAGRDAAAPARCRPSALIPGRGPEPEGLQEHNPRPHFTDATTEAREGLESADEGRDWEGSATWRRPHRGPRAGGVRRDAQGDDASFLPPRGSAAGTSALLRDRRRQTPRSSPARRAGPRSRAPPWRIPALLRARPQPPGLRGSRACPCPQMQAQQV